MKRNKQIRNCFFFVIMSRMGMKENKRVTKILFPVLLMWGGNIYTIKKNQLVTKTVFPVMLMLGGGGMKENKHKKERYWRLH